MARAGSGKVFEGLRKIVARLRAPDGCPWDREQTHASIKPNLVEECYETLEALDSGDPARMREELGDLLLQVMLHAQMADEAGEFTIRDVIAAISDKLVRRHPHVFGDVQVSSVQEVWGNWERIKREEKGEDRSLLQGVPRGMPALAQSQALLDRASRIRLRWEPPAAMADVVRSLEGRWTSGAPIDQLGEVGNFLFTLASSARDRGIDLEEALRVANRRFIEQFERFEALCAAKGLVPDALADDARAHLWQEAEEDTRA